MPVEIKFSIVYDSVAYYFGFCTGGYDFVYPVYALFGISVCVSLETLSTGDLELQGKMKICR